MKKYNILLISGELRSGKDTLANSIIDLAPNLNDSYKRMAFADELKKYACKISNLSLEELNDLKNMNKSFIVRFKNLELKLLEILQEIDTNLKLNLNYTKENLNYITSSFLVLMNDNKVVLSEKGSEESKLFELDCRKFLQYFGDFIKHLTNDETIFAKLLIFQLNKNYYNTNLVLPDFRYPFEYSALELFIGKKYNIKTIKVLGKKSKISKDILQHASETSLDNFKFDYYYNNSIYDEESQYYQTLALIKELNNTRINNE